VSVDRDSACGDQVLACSPAAHAGRRQELLQAHAIGIMNIDLDRWLLRLWR
jgi:hypothetical protein